MSGLYDVWVFADGRWQQHTTKPFTEYVAGIQWAERYIPHAEATVWPRNPSGRVSAPRHRRTDKEARAT